MATAVKRVRRPPRYVAPEVPGAFVLAVAAVYPTCHADEVELVLALPDDMAGPVATLTLCRQDWPGRTWPPKVDCIVRVIPARIELADEEGT